MKTKIHSIFLFAPVDPAFLAQVLAAGQITDIEIAGISVDEGAIIIEANRFLTTQEKATVAQIVGSQLIQFEDMNQ